MARPTTEAPFRRGFIYVADESGAEIAGSRRSLANCMTAEDARRLWSELEALAGAGCTVQHSEAGETVPW